MLRIAEQWFDSNVGRQRHGNEDNYFVRAPLFVVADGMGGAQAGEVASQMAVEAFQPGLPNGNPVEALVEVIGAANKRIHDMSRSDSQRSGMGTTCTAAYVAEDEVVLAHVGDSRCYLFRDGELTRLTRDHSLVGELVDRGKLTEEQAEVHPQRSVITRALGPEPEVQVDTERIQARSGDVFLLCSDGLTSMIREPVIAPIMTEASTLEEAGRNLIAAANAAGGRDNITVILFRLDEVEVGGGAADEQTEVTAATGDGRQDRDAPTRAGEDAPATADVADAVKAADLAEAEAEYRRHGTVALSTIKAPEAEEASAASAAPPRTAPLAEAKKPRRRLRAGPLIAAVVVAAIVGIGAWIATRAVFFIDTDANRAVTIYRGLPYELPLGIDLYSTHFSSGVTLDQVPPARREAFTNRKLRSLDDATDLVRQLEEGKLDG